MLARMEARAIPSALEGVSAWITPVTVLPIGMTFTIIARMSVRGIRYYPTAVAVINGQRVEIGASWSADARMSTSTFWHPLDAAQALAGDTVVELFEADEARDRHERSHVDTIELGPISASGL